MNYANRLSWMLIVVTLSGGLLLWQHQRQQTHQFPAQADAAADAFAGGIRAKQFDEQGQLVRDFQAASLVATDKLTRTLATQPVLKATLSNGRKITLQAKQGTLFERQRLQLDGEVSLQTSVQSTDNTSLPVTVLAPHIDFVFKTEVASTDEAIHLYSPQRFSLHAEGAIADFKQQTIWLKHKVRGQYAPIVQ